MKIETLENKEEWDKFVAGAPEASFFHTLAWRDVLEKTFKYKCSYLVIRNDVGLIAGVYPTVRLKKMCFFSAADSLPDSDVCGPLIDEEYTKEGLLALKSFLDKKGLGRDLAYVRIKTQDKEICEYLKTKGSTVDTFSGTMVLDLQKNSSDHIWNGLHKSCRKHIMRFEHDSVITRLAESEKDLERFYYFYSLNMNKRGLPPLPYALFKNIFDLLFPERFNMLLLEKEGRCLGVGIFFIHPENNTLYGWNIGMDKSVGGRYKIQSKIYWEWIKYAEDNKFRCLNFGSTPSDPSSKVYSLKKNFGAEFIQDYTLNLPSNKKIFFVRETIIQAGRRVKNILPTSWIQRVSGSI
jgi:hypothetical protein